MGLYVLALKNVPKQKEEKIERNHIPEIISGIQRRIKDGAKQNG